MSSVYPKPPNVTFTAPLTTAPFSVTFSVRNKYEVPALLTTSSRVTASLFVAFYASIRCSVKTSLLPQEFAAGGSRMLQRSRGPSPDATCIPSWLSSAVCTAQGGGSGMLCVPAPGTQGGTQSKEGQSVSSHERQHLSKKQQFS